MALARLIVCEATCKWTVALRRQLPRDSWSRLSETRSLDDCWRETRTSPTSIVVMEVTTANLEQLAERLPRFGTEFPRACVSVVGSRQLAATQWLMRELGAVHTVFSSRNLNSLVRIIQRHWSRIAGEDPTGDPFPWPQLPWGRGEFSSSGRKLDADATWLGCDSR